MAVAPLISGALTQHVTWRWCFYINLPLGGFSLGVITLLFRNPKSQKLVPMTFKEKLRSMDLLGLFLLLPSVICLLLALQWGGTTYAWDNARIIILLILAAALFGVFMFVQGYKKTNVTLPIRVLKQRSVALSIAYAFCMGGSIFLVEYYVSFPLLLLSNCMKSLNKLSASFPYGSNQFKMHLPGILESCCFPF